MIKQLYNIIIALVASMVLYSCGGGNIPNGIIASNDNFTLKGDSLVMGDTVVYSTDGFTIKTNLKNSEGEEMQLSFPPSEENTAGIVTSEHKLIDALSAMSISIISNRNYIHFDNTNDLYDAIGLTLSYTDPELSMQLLKDQVEDGVIKGKDNAYYPAHNDRLAWTPAAWRVYLVTGDREWLKYAYNVSIKTFEQEQEIAYYKRDWLVRGCPSDDKTPLTMSLPSWMEKSDIFSTFTLSNNVVTAQALNAMGEMASELGLNGTKYSNLAHDLCTAVNENLWNEKHGQYTALIYGQSCTLHAPCSDNRAQALAVMWGIADEDDRATTLIKKTKVMYNGVNNFIPALNHSTEPCLHEPSWGLTQGLWNMAAAHVDNDEALCAGLAALWRAQALYSTIFVNEGTANLDITSAISNIAMTHRLIAGMNFDAEGIEFSPVVPACLTGDKVLTEFNYRGSKLNITVKGTGHDVDFILLDDIRINGNFISASQLKGQHSIIITMKDSRSTSQGVTTINHVEEIPEEPIVEWNGDSAHIINYNPSFAYKLVIDGELKYTISDSSFVLPQIGNFSEIAVTASNYKRFSYTSRPFIMGGSKYKNYIINTTQQGQGDIELNINVPEGGDYMISISYTNDTPTCDARIVTANNHKQGVTLLGSIERDDIAGQSNLIHVDLLKNNNKVVISGLPACHGQAKPISVNVFKK